MRGCLSCAPYGVPDLALNPGMCADLESNQQLFGLQAGTQFTEPHQPRLLLGFYINLNSFHF